MAAVKKKYPRKPPIKSGRSVPKGFTPVKRGEVRNPLGKPKGLTVLQEIKLILKQRVGKQGSGKYDSRTYAKAVAQSFIDMAKSGSYVHAKEIIEREDGKVSSSVIINDGSDTKLYINVPEV